MTTASSPSQRRLALFAWLAVCLIWGTTYLGIRISLETMPPMLMGGLRWTLAGGTLAIYMAARGERLHGRDAIRGALLLGFLMLVLGNGGVVWAEQHVPSGLAAVVVAASPFWMAGVETFYPDGDRLNSRKALGLILGFAGIVLLVWPELTQGGNARTEFPAWDGVAPGGVLRLVDWFFLLEAARAWRSHLRGNGGADARRWCHDAGHCHRTW